MRGERVTPIKSLLRLSCPGLSLSPPCGHPSPVPPSPGPACTLLQMCSAVLLLWEKDTFPWRRGAHEELGMGSRCGRVEVASGRNPLPTMLQQRPNVLGVSGQAAQGRPGPRVGTGGTRSGPED